MEKHLVGDSDTEIGYRTKIIYTKVAAQVLSETVGIILNNFGPEEAARTGKFCLMMDKFFDCLNVRNTKEHVSKRKPFKKPYEPSDDVRFVWLDEFLNYFKLWKDSIEERSDAKYSDNAQSKIFTSWQSYEGLRITVFSFKKSMQVFVTTRYSIYFL